MSKKLKRFALLVVLSTGVALSTQAASPFGTPVGSAESGSIAVSIFVGSLPLGVTLLSIG